MLKTIEILEFDMLYAVRQSGLTEENGLFPTAMAFVAPDAPRVAISIAGVEANCTAMGD